MIHAIMKGQVYVFKAFIFQHDYLSTIYKLLKTSNIRLFIRAKDIYIYIER